MHPLLLIFSSSSFLLIFFLPLQHLFILLVFSFLTCFHHYPCLNIFSLFSSSSSFSYFILSLSSSSSSSSFLSHLPPLNSLIPPSHILLLLILVLLIIRYDCIVYKLRGLAFNEPSSKGLSFRHIKLHLIIVTMT